MKQNLFQKDGTYGRLGFLLSNDGDLIPFGYRDIYDVVLNVGYENIDYTYHNSALCEELKHNPYLEGLKMKIEYEIRNKADGRLLGTGETSHCFTNSNMRPIYLKKVNKEFFDIFEKAINKKD